MKERDDVDKREVRRWNLRHIKSYYDFELGENQQIVDFLQTWQEWLKVEFVQLHKWCVEYSTVSATVTVLKTFTVQL